MPGTQPPQALAALAILGVMLTAPAPGAQSAAAPSIDDLINLKRVGSPAISPNGQLVAYTIREANWDENAYETEIWIGDAATGQSRQVTNARKSSSQPAFSPDGAWLGFVSDRDGKRQLYRIALRGGEAEKLTSVDEGVTSFAWSPDSKRIAFTMTDPATEAMKEREKRWGDIRIEDQDQRYTHLHVFDIAAKASKQLTSGNFVVGSFEWSPDGRNIAYDHRATSDPADGGLRTSRYFPSTPTSPWSWSPRRDRTRIPIGRPTGRRSRSSPPWVSRTTSTRTASSPRSRWGRRRRGA
jgi:Tol biopolymer transport system component